MRHRQEERRLAPKKALEKILRGTSDANIPFDDLRRVLENLGFDERIRGSHHIFSREGVAEILNLQPKGNKAKPYQVKQVRHVILKYHMGGEPGAKAQV
jgi:virulence-associated protein VapD